MTRNYWNRVLDSRMSRRRALAATGATALGSALLIACGGGGSGSGLKFEDAGNSRQPGTVWSAKNDWKLADETKDAVRGGIYRGYMTADQAGHFDAIALVSSQVPFSPHVLEMLMARNRGPGIEPGTVEASNPAGALAESWRLHRTA